MLLLGFRLGRLGHAVGYFRYYTRTEKFVDIVQRLVARVKSLPSDQLPCHLILLASPNQPPRLAPIAKRNPLYRYLTTDCGQRVLSADFYQELPVPTVPTTVIAGSGGPRVSWMPYGDEPNDGVMSVQDTYLGSGVEVIDVPSIHTFIMNSRQTLAHIQRILEG